MTIIVNYTTMVSYNPITICIAPHGSKKQRQEVKTDEIRQKMYEDSKKDTYVVKYMPPKIDQTPIKKEKKP